MGGVQPSKGKQRREGAATTFVVEAPRPKAFICSASPPPMLLSLAARQTFQAHFALESVSSSFLRSSSRSSIAPLGSRDQRQTTQINTYRALFYIRSGDRPLLRAARVGKRERTDASLSQHARLIPRSASPLPAGLECPPPGASSKEGIWASNSAQTFRRLSVCLSIAP